MKFQLFLARKAMVTQNKILQKNVVELNTR